jgi:hypothetical protein
MVPTPEKPQEIAIAPLRADHQEFEDSAILEENGSPTGV